MTFKAKLDDPESRAFWKSVRKGAEAYDAMPDWQKGVLGPRARIVIDDRSETDAQIENAPEPEINT